MNTPLDRILFAELRFDARVGILPGESDSLQPLGGELELCLDLQAVAANDELSEGFDYRHIPELLEGLATAGACGLLETLAARIGDAILVERKVKSVRVRLWKRRPPLGDSVGQVAVELWRHQPSAESQ